MSREKKRANQRRYRAKNKEKINKANREYEARIGRHLKRYYGLTKDDYNRMFDNQKGCCAICTKHQTQLSRSLSVDHNHSTDRIRGLLCSECNFGLGKFLDNKELLLNAIKYLSYYDEDLVNGQQPETF